MAKILALINQLSQNKFSDNYYKIKKTEMIFMTIFGWIPIQQKREKTTSMKMSNITIFYQHCRLTSLPLPGTLHLEVTRKPIRFITIHFQYRSFVPFKKHNNISVLCVQARDYPV